VEHKVKIAFVSQLNSKDIGEWSGTPYFMVQSLRARGHSVLELNCSTVALNKLVENANKIHRKLSKTSYDFNRNPWVAKLYSRRVKKVINQGDFDVIICPSSISCAYLETDTPIITWEDATFAGMVNYYQGGWQRLSKLAILQGNKLQQLSLNNTKLSVFCSDWAAQSALDNYQINNKSKVRVIRFGANLLESPSYLDVSSAIENRSNSNCSLLFIGVDWQRKGGDLVIQTATALKSRGFQVTVDIVGCEPIGEVPDFVNKHGFISKSTPEGRMKIRELLLTSHYLFVPSIAECYGIVFAEASAHGLPSLARATGGVPSVINNGVNGYAFPMEAGCEVYADYIENEFTSNNFKSIAYQARKHYEEHLNWDASIAELESATQQIFSC
jgi:glycosyltransferase involved in cell wall biosynthesis